MRSSIFIYIQICLYFCYIYTVFILWLLLAPYAIVVFKNKKKRKEHKYLAVMNKLNGQLAFLRAVSQANVLNSHQRALLDELCELLAQNERSFFNFKLRRFLRRHKSTFLRVFSNEEKVIGRMCRGKWYFFFIPFA